MGFVSASDVIKDHMKIDDAGLREVLIITVGCLGFVVLLLTILGSGLDYGTRVAYHVTAAEDLKRLSDKVRLYRVERAMDDRKHDEDEELRELFDDDDDGSTESTDDDDDDEDDEVGGGGVTIPHGEDRLMLHTGGGGQLVVARGGGGQLAVAARGMEKAVKRKMKQTKRIHRQNARLTKNLVNDRVRRAREEQDLSKDAITFYGYHTELQQIRRGCRSDVPPHIANYFSVMEGRVELMSLSRLGVEEDSRMRKNQIVRLCANEIYNEVSNYIFWPLFAPMNVDRTIEGALRRVGQLLNMNYRARRRCKLIPCCPVPLCCKKTTSDNVFVIINEGIDQRELDLMQAERIELIRMEKERRERRNAGPEEVRMVRDTFYLDGDDDGGGGGGGNNAARPKGTRNPLMMIANSVASSGRTTREPDGSVYTEQSFSFQPSRGGSAALHPQDRGDYMITDDDDVDYVSRFSASEFEDIEAGRKPAAKKKKKGKDKKKDRKNKDKKKDKKENKKDKKKKKKDKGGNGGEVTDEYSDEEEEGEEYGYDDEEEYGTAYSERYSSVVSQMEKGVGGYGSVRSGNEFSASEKHSAASEKYSAASEKYSAASDPEALADTSRSSIPSSKKPSVASAKLSLPSSARLSAPTSTFISAASGISSGKFSGVSATSAKSLGKFSFASSRRSSAASGKSFASSRRSSAASGKSSGKFSAHSARSESTGKFSGAHSARTESEGQSMYSMPSSKDYSGASGKSSVQSAINSEGGRSGESTDSSVRNSETGRSEYSAHSGKISDRRSEYSAHSGRISEERSEYSSQSGRMSEKRSEYSAHSGRISEGHSYSS
jgi:hypothetical protein